MDDPEGYDLTDWRFKSGCPEAPFVWRWTLPPRAFHSHVRISREVQHFLTLCHVPRRRSTSGFCCRCLHCSGPHWLACSAVESPEPRGRRSGLLQNPSRTIF